MEARRAEFTSDEYICSHFADDYRGQKGSVSPPIFQSSTHIFDTCEEMTAWRGTPRSVDGERTYFYGREGNPTVEVLEAKLAELERAGGAVTGSWDRIRELARIRSQYGGILHPQESYLALRGLRTLPVRMKLHQHNGTEIAEYLSRHPKIVTVNFPGLESHPQHELAERQMLGYSSLMSMVIDAPAERARLFVNDLRLFKIAVSWGGYESLIIEPRQEGDDPGRSNVRFYVGQDNLGDLLTDLDESLKLL